MDEALLGRTLLKAMKFDLRHNMETLSNEESNRHMSDLRSKAEKFAVSTYRNISYKSADENPIPPTEKIVTGLGKERESKIKNAVDKIMFKALKNGVSQYGKKVWRESSRKTKM